MAKLKGLKKFKRDINPDRMMAKVLKIVANDYSAEIIAAVISSAKRGIGPKDASYPAYSAKYKAKFGSGKEFLKVTGKLLNKRRFKMKAKRLTLKLQWASGGNRKLGIIAEVHNSGVGNIPRREFVHLNNTPIGAKLNKAVDKAFDRVVREFNRVR